MTAKCRASQPCVAGTASLKYRVPAGSRRSFTTNLDIAQWVEQQTFKSAGRGFDSRYPDQQTANLSGHVPLV
jgi:hypothetical protein